MSEIDFECMQLQIAKLKCFYIKGANTVLGEVPYKKGLLIVTMEHKTSHKGQFCEIEIYASSES